jgi:hypothetical protein
MQYNAIKKPAMRRNAQTCAGILFTRVSWCRIRTGERSRIPAVLATRKKAADG